MSLANAENTCERFYSLSSQIESERKDYYKQLEKQQRHNPDITKWLSWFFSCLGKAISDADSIMNKVLFKSALWQLVNQQSVNTRQRSIINRMLEDDFEGHMNTSKYARMAKCSKDTALRDTQELNYHGILIQNTGGGRSTSYRLTDTMDE